MASEESKQTELDSQQNAEKEGNPDCTDSLLSLSTSVQPQSENSTLAEEASLSQTPFVSNPANQLQVSQIKTAPSEAETAPKEVLLPSDSNPNIDSINPDSQTGEKLEPESGNETATEGRIETQLPESEHQHLIAEPGAHNVDNQVEISAEVGEQQQEVDNERGMQESKKEIIFGVLQSSAIEVSEKFGGKDETAREDDESVSTLLGQLESFLGHGLKKKLCQSVMDMAPDRGAAAAGGGVGGTGARGGETAPIAVLTVKEFTPVLWDYLKELIEPEEKSRLEALQQVQTRVGRGRAWVRDCLATKRLFHYYGIILAENSLLEKFFDEFACLRDKRCGSALENVAKCLHNVNLDLPVDSSHLDENAQEPEGVTEKVWHYEIHAPWPHESQNSGDPPPQQQFQNQMGHMEGQPGIQATNQPQTGQYQSVVVNNPGFAEPLYAQLSGYAPNHHPQGGHYQSMQGNNRNQMNGMNQQHQPVGHMGQQMQGEMYHHPEQGYDDMSQYIQPMTPHMHGNSGPQYNQQSNFALPKIEELMGPPTARMNPHHHQAPPTHPPPQPPRQMAPAPQVYYLDQGHQYESAPMPEIYHQQTYPSDNVMIQSTSQAPDMHPANQSNIPKQIPNRKRPRKDKHPEDPMKMARTAVTESNLDAEGIDQTSMDDNMDDPQGQSGRGRGRPRQRPKIQGLPPPADKEEAKEQTATFHRVYERVRRTEIKKGYDTLEQLIPFHLRSDILRSKKHFSTTDVLNCARDYIEELKSDEMQHRIIITQMETERDAWREKLKKVVTEALRKNKMLLSNESLPEFESMEYKTSLAQFIPHVCLPNIGIPTGFFQKRIVNQTQNTQNSETETAIEGVATETIMQSEQGAMEGQDGGQQPKPEEPQASVTLDNQTIMSTAPCDIGCNEEMIEECIVYCDSIPTH